MPFESNTETGRISVMKGSRRVLVKVVLFQLRGHGHSQDDATPNSFCKFWMPYIRAFKWGIICSRNSLERWLKLRKRLSSLLGVCNNLGATVTIPIFNARFFWIRKAERRRKVGDIKEIKKRWFEALNTMEATEILCPKPYFSLFTHLTSTNTLTS